jgi:hypothetical protein
MADKPYFIEQRFPGSWMRPDRAGFRKLISRDCVSLCGNALLYKRERVSFLCAAKRGNSPAAAEGIQSPIAAQFLETFAQ